MSAIPQSSSLVSFSGSEPPPSEPAILDRKRDALRELLRLVSERALAEVDVERTHSNNTTTAEREYQSSRSTLLEQYEANKESERKNDEARRRSVVDRAIAGENEAKGEFSRASRKIAADFETARERTKSEHNRDRAVVTAAYDSAEKEAQGKYAEAIRPIDKAMKVVESMRARLAVVFQDYKKFGLAEASTTPSRDRSIPDNPVDAIFDRLAKTEAPLKLLEELLIPKALKGSRHLRIFVLVFLLLIWPAIAMAGAVAGASITVVATLVLGFLIRARLSVLAKEHVSRYYYPIFQTLVDAEALAAHCRSLAEEEFKKRRVKNTEIRENDLNLARKKQAKAVASDEETRDDRLRKINEVYALRIVDVQSKQQVELREAIENYDRLKVEQQTRHENSVRRLDERYRALTEKVRAHHESALRDLATRWREGMARLSTTVDAINHTVDSFGLRWDDGGWNDRAFPTAVPPIVRLGDTRIALAALPGGIATDPALMEGITESFVFPAVLPFPARANLLIETPSAGRAAASAVLQSSMLRLLTSLPPGQVRFTIIDPIGIGRNFGAFMHLADYDPALVNGQVWTETRQIEERLAEISAHMEKVTQRYLRNEYATIEEYNAVAGEVAEPYRVLVVADFPAGFDEKTASRLAAIAGGGVSCGVFTLLAVDVERPSDVPFPLAEVRESATNLIWESGQLVTRDPDFGKYPLALDQPPPAEFATRLIHKAGAAARDAKRVAVPFEFIAPVGDAWWTQDSRGGIDVPLGKAGATKRQNFLLGQGTAQHALLAGRTGSGKSTLLHALITNLALNYSPDEIDLCLIDFKKGVEFKVYATHMLPHASVVAIESEREFGISVLQRLDAAMRDRADRFRDAGVQDVTGFRNVAGSPPLPRMMLIVDEFQEFFVEEDKLAHEAALLLDRLVRQGRAFGIHVILGSQSLGGAFALARTTLGQMAVRIALQCSDADAHLILSESNTAAQSLTRPGEAVYNNANGLAEGNHFFQVVWLSDESRAGYLKRLRAMADERKPALARTPIVFEGDTEADLALNPLLRPRLEAPNWPASPRSAQAWLGDAVAIKDPTAALFRRQGANHLLIVGQKDESARGILSAALFSLAAQYPPAQSDTVRSGVRFAILDGTPEDHPQADYLARLAGRFPHPIVVGGLRDSAKIMSDLGGELERRQRDAGDGPEIFLLIHDLPRFRDLRRRENDYGFGRKDEEASPSDHLSAILREGPPLGIHVLAWCDNVINLNRVFDHQTLREFEMRVLFQMSPNDSGHLLDSPAASKLGPQRAYLASEEQNLLEKFRPYALPTEEWLEWASEQFRKRATPQENEGAPPPSAAE